MKLSNPKLEYRALRTICQSPLKNEKNKLLTTLKSDHFYDDGAAEVFKFLKKYIRKNGDLPTWHEVETSPKLSESTRVEVEGYSDVKAIKTKAGIRQLQQDLEDFRKSRVLYFTSEKIRRDLDNDGLNITELYSKIHRNINNNAIAVGSEIEVLSFADESSSAKLITYLIDEDKSGEVIPTGFAEFDSENGGLPSVGLTILAATTGGGKSAMMVQMGINMALAGYKVHMVPLEMTKEELGARVVANVAKIDVRKYTGAMKLSEKEKVKSHKKMKRFQKDLKDSKGNIRIYEPEEDLLVEDLFAVLLPYDDDVIFVDYIGLMGGVDGDNQWAVLGAIARYAKRWSTLHKKQVIFLAQLSDEGAIRYSKAIKDHANNFWCVPGDTLVTTPSGLRRIDRLQGWFETTASHFNVNLPVVSRGEHTKAVNFLNQGVKPVYELYTERGNWLAATQNEKFLTLNNTLDFVWKEMSALKRGDLLVRNKMLAGNQDVARLTPQPFLKTTYCSTEFATVVAIYTIHGVNGIVRSPYAHEFFFALEEIAHADARICGDVVHIGNESLVTYLETRRHEVPFEILTSRTQDISTYLKYVLTSTYTKDHTYIGTKRMVKSLHNALLSINGAPKSHYDTLSYIDLTADTDKSMNIQLVGKALGLKVDNLQSLLTKSGNMSKRVQKVLAELDNCKQHLDVYAYNEYRGNEVVYDLSVPDTHEYIANGFSIHNCWVFTEQNAESGEIMVVQQKARNQRMFNFPLAIDFATMTFRNVGEQVPSSKAVSKIEKHLKRIRRGERDANKREKRKSRE